MGAMSYKKTLHACYRGYITQAIVVNLAPLFFVIFQDEYNVSYVTLGSIVLLNFVIQLLTDALSIRFIEKVGYKKAAVCAHAFAAAGLFLFGVIPIFVPAIFAVTVSTVIFAIGGGLLEVIVSPIVDAIPGEAKESSMSLLHSFYCWGQVSVILITTLLLFFVGSSRWHVIPIVWALVPVYNLIAFTKVPIAPALSEEKHTSFRKLINSKTFLCILLLMLCAGASELALAQWASFFTEKGLSMSKTTGDILGPCMFGVMMGVGRTIYGIYGSRIRILKVLTLCSVLCVVSYLLTSLVSYPVFSLLGIALCGVSVSLMWPGMISFAAGKFKNGGTAMFGILALFGDVGCSVGPWLIGVVSQMSNSFGQVQALRNGVLAAIIFPVVMLLGTLVLQKKDI